MTGRWALSMPPSEAVALRGLRRAVGLQVCESGGLIWLRGESCDERLEQRLRMIPGARRFTLLPDRQLQPCGGRAPDGFLPEGPWKPLVDWLGVELPSAGWSGEAPARLQITVERAMPPVDEATAAPTLLLTTLRTWAAYARTAPQVRLERWTFAADESSRVLLRGAPLPPLPGERFIEQGGVAVPLGWHWRPAVDPTIVRKVLRRESPAFEENDLAILFRDGTWQRIPADSFVGADRRRSPAHRGGRPMTLDPQESARRYLTPPSQSFWQWRDEGEAIAWLGGRTIAFRVELAETLRRREADGLPPLGAVLLLLAAMRDSWGEPPSELGTLSGLINFLNGCGAPLGASEVMVGSAQ